MKPLNCKQFMSVNYTYLITSSIVKCTVEYTMLNVIALWYIHETIQLLLYCYSHLSNGITIHSVVTHGKIYDKLYKLA